MLKIYGVYRSRASRPIWLAGELGLAFEHVPVIQAYRLADPVAGEANGQVHTQSAAYLAVHPGGQIPAMDDDGVILFESLAITLYLAKKHGGSMAPRDLIEDGRMTMWSLWAAADVEPHSIQVLYHLAAKPPQERDPSIAAAAIEALRRPFKVLEAALEREEYLVGNRFTVADLNVAEIVRYALPAKSLFEAHPRVAAWLARCHARPAFKQMMARREAEPA
jgi:glutathione S-transferase